VWERGNSYPIHRYGTGFALNIMNQKTRLKKQAKKLYKLKKLNELNELYKLDELFQRT
jgi:hypothetical protein